MRKLDLSGLSFGDLVAVCPTHDRGPDGSVVWECLCVCGQACTATSNSLRTGNKKSCGCSVRRDWTGTRLGRLTVVSKTSQRKYGNCSVWECVCDCGNTKMVSDVSIRSQSTQSCGCLWNESRKESTRKHGHSVEKDGRCSSTYKSWCGMKERCFNENSGKFDSYGGRGVTVCDRWKNSFEHFLEDMGERPEGTTLDRVNPDGNYEPGNCRWATPAQQARNRRNNVLDEIKVAAIRNMLDEGKSYNFIANAFKISPSTVQGVKERKIWKDVA